MKISSPLLLHSYSPFILLFFINNHSYAHIKSVDIIFHLCFLLYIFYYLIIICIWDSPAIKSSCIVWYELDFNHGRIIHFFR